MSTTPVTVSLAVKADPEAIWSALTDGEITPAYYYGFAIESDLTAGSEYRYTVGGAPMITGAILDVVDGEAITMSFNGAWDPNVAELDESIVTFAIAEPAMPTPGVSILTMTHDGLPEGPTTENVANGWVLILSGLKTLLETGQPLAAAPDVAA